MVTELRELTPLVASNSGAGSFLSLVPPSLESGFSPLQIVSFITLKAYSFNEINFLGTFWFGITDLQFPGVARNHELDQRQLNHCHECLERARGALNYVDLIQAAKYVSNVREKLSKGEAKTYGAYRELVGTLWEVAINEIEGMVFGFLPQEHGKHFNQAALFGQEVNDKFRDAIYDIKEAGNCYAHGTYTACVFHLMRALEIALHKLATDLGVTFPTALELENWQNIIEKIESAMRDREKQLPKGAQKSEEMQYYSEAAKEFRYFKDAWRNHVSHSRVDYEIHDATKIMEHVREFMRHLASKD